MSARWVTQPDELREGDRGEADPLPDPRIAALLADAREHERRAAEHEAFARALHTQGAFHDQRAETNRSQAVELRRQTRQ